MVDSICPGGGWKYITWEDQNTYKYQYEDLERCVEASAHMAVTSKSTSCSPIASAVLCASAACKVGISLPGTEAEDDMQPSCKSYDPPYCYKEQSKMKFNVGTNIGLCSHIDTCLCMSPTTEAPTTEAPTTEVPTTEASANYDFNITENPYQTTLSLDCSTLLEIRDSCSVQLV